jgi:hypothetical protein
MKNVCYFINFDYNLTMVEFHTKNFSFFKILKFQGFGPKNVIFELFFVQSDLFKVKILKNYFIQLNLSKRFIKSTQMWWFCP